MVFDIKSILLRHNPLPLLDNIIDKFNYFSALYAHDVIVVGALFQLKDRMAAFEMMTRY